MRHKKGAHSVRMGIQTAVGGRMSGPATRTGRVGKSIVDNAIVAAGQEVRGGASTVARWHVGNR